MSDHISYKALYFHLFRATAQAVDYLEQGKTITACDCLIQAQKESEEAFLENDILPEQ